MTSRKYTRLKRRSIMSAQALQRELKLRAEAQALTEQALEMQRGLAGDLVEKNRRMRELVNELTEALPRGYAGLPPAARKMDGPSRQHVVTQVEQELRLAPISLNASIKAVEYHVERLLVLIGNVDVDQFARELHFDMEFGDGHLCYAITQDALRDMDPRRLAREVADSLALQFVRQLRDGPMGKRRLA